MEEVVQRDEERKLSDLDYLLSLLAPELQKELLTAPMQLTRSDVLQCLAQGEVSLVRKVVCAFGSENVLNMVAGSQLKPFETARVLWTAGHAGAAKEIYGQLLASDSNYVKAMNDLALIFEEEGDMKNAKKYFESALHADSQNVLALNSLGRISFNENDINAAKGYFERVLAADSQNVLALNSLGFIFYEGGDIAGAKSFYSVSSEIGNSQACLMMCVICLQLGLHEEARSFELRLTDTDKNALAQLVAAMKGEALSAKSH